MCERFENNLKLLTESLESGLNEIIEAGFTHESESLLTKNYKTQDLEWRHTFLTEWMENYQQANLSVTVEYSESYPNDINTKLSGSAGKEVSFSISKTESVSRVIEEGVSNYLIRLMKDAKSDINESI